MGATVCLIVFREGANRGELGPAWSDEFKITRVHDVMTILGQAPSVTVPGMFIGRGLNILELHADAIIFRSSAQTLRRKEIENCCTYDVPINN